MRKSKLKFDLSGEGPKQFARDVSMMRCIAAGLLKKNGASLGKDSIIKDHKAEYKKFRKQPKDYQKAIERLAKPGPAKKERPKCSRCGQPTDSPSYRDERISMFTEGYRASPLEIISSALEREAWRDVGNR